MNNEKPFASLRNQKKILLKNLLPIWLFTIWPFCHDGGGAQVGCLTARDTVGASPVDAHARTGSDYGFKFQVSSRRGRLRTRTAQPDCDVAENLQIITRKFGYVRKKT